MSVRSLCLLCVWLLSAGWGFGQSDAATMAERFAPGSRSRVDLRVEISGEVTAPGKAGSKIDITGTSVLRYDERVLPTDEPGSHAVLRLYRDVDFTRTIGGETQKQEIRPSVRRMVVLRSADGKKAPFSPDGPLTYGEIDAVRVDLFSPVLVAGLLPMQAVKPGDRWTVETPATLDLTGLEKIESGKLTAEYVGAVVIGGAKKHRISVTGSISGLSEDGPTRQQIDATCYFDPDEKRLTYLSLKGTQELLDGNGKTVGRLTGRFTMNRNPTTELNDSSVGKISAKPTAEDALLLYDNPDLGVRFVHPRNWRVGAVQGQQITVEDPKAGGGILITIESEAKTPRAEAYMKEAREFIVSQKGKVLESSGPRRSDEVSRFRLDAEINGEKVRMEYAVRVDRGIGGLTFAARIPAKQTRDLVADVERILKDLKRTK
ncbi:MAG: hypothetical protein U0798_00890 [Gemmataceae bacterium]